MYLFKYQSGTHRERDIVCFLVHYPNGPSVGPKPKPKPETKPPCGSHPVVRSPTTVANICFSKMH